MTGNEQSALGQQIDNRNPYSFLFPPPPPPPPSSMHLEGAPAAAPPPPPPPAPPPPWILEIEEDAYVDSSWQFKGGSLRVKKAIRIPYNYQDKYGNYVREYLLIGYEGSGSE